MPRTASGPWVSSSPASTKVIGAVTSNRSSLRVLSEGGDEDGLDGVQAVLGLVEDDAGR
jgi:hypothetical protein